MPLCQFEPTLEAPPSQWVCVRCGFVTHKPFNRAPSRECHGKRLPTTSQKCRYLGEVVRELAPGTTACGSRSVVLHRCNHHGDLTSTRRLSQATAAMLQEVDDEYQGRTCATCTDKPTGLVRCLGDKRCSQNTTSGIVTGASSEHWPCLGAIAIAAAEESLGFAVADHGLEAWQRDELEHLGVRWIEHGRPSLDDAKSHRKSENDLRAWWKPWICKASPFDLSLWVDADAVLVGDMSELFEKAKLQPCISTQARWSPSGRVYRPLLQELFPQVDATVSADLLTINSGLLAWSRNEPLIDEWMQYCERIMPTELAGRVIVRDQAALLCALLRRYLDGDVGVTLLESAWNVPADNLPSGKSKARKPISLDPCELLATAKRRHPDAKLVHWLGGVKPWTIRQQKTGRLPT